MANGNFNTGSLVSEGVLVIKCRGAEGIPIKKEEKMAQRAQTHPLHAMWLKDDLMVHPELDHPQRESLVSIIVGGSNVSSAGFPYIVEESFNRFIQKVPHLFEDGQGILDWVNRLDTVIASRTDIEPPELTSLSRTRTVLRTMVYTAAVTSPSDLWLLRQNIRRSSMS